VLVVFTGVSVIAPFPDGFTPERVPITLDVQLKSVEGTDDTGNKFSASPLQMLWMNEAGGDVITGLGLTVTVTSIKLPEQPSAIGVIL
jgi:hypothetical protein